MRSCKSLDYAPLLSSSSKITGQLSRGWISVHTYMISFSSSFDPSADSLFVSNIPFPSSLGEFPGYWDWLWYPGLPPVLVSITFFPFAFHFVVFFHSLFFACPWIYFVSLL